MKIIFKTNHKEFKKAQIIDVSKNVAHGLIEKGVAQVFVPYEKKNTRLTNKNKFVKLK